MEFLNNSKNYSLNRKTYVNLRWIAIIGQLISINLAYLFFNFEFSFIKANNIPCLIFLESKEIPETFNPLCSIL